MSFFEGLNAEKYDRQYSDRQLIRRIADYFRPQTKRLVLVTVLVLGAVTGAILTPPPEPAEFRATRHWLKAVL